MLFSLGLLRDEWWALQSTHSSSSTSFFCVKDSSERPDRGGGWGESGWSLAAVCCHGAQEHVRLRQVRVMRHKTLICLGLNGDPWLKFAPPALTIRGDFFVFTFHCRFLIGREKDGVESEVARLINESLDEDQSSEMVSCCCLVWFCMGKKNCFQY